MSFDSRIKPVIDSSAAKLPKVLIFLISSGATTETEPIATYKIALHMLFANSYLLIQVITNHTAITNSAKITVGFVAYDNPNTIPINRIFIPLLPDTLRALSV